MKKYKLGLFLCGLSLLPAAWSEEVLRLATTTSLDNSGLLEYLLPKFEQQCACRVLVIPVGSGKALSLGRHGDVDVVMVHAPEAEGQFVAEGYGSDWRQIAYNHFLLLAPPGDPAQVGAQRDVLTVLQSIADKSALFLSRGDDSGTHKKELALWRRLEQSGSVISYDPAWYIEAGSGMGQAIVMADQLGAYLLSDTATYLYFQDKVALQPLALPASDLLYNPYSVIRVNEARHPHVKAALAKQFVDWLQQPATRRLIAGYRLLGQPLFTPIAP